MRRLKNHSALLSKYKLMYEKKPRSRVFAPLAETYRKLGMVDESLKILKSGIRSHPSYTLGYIVLAHCYFDKQNFEMAYTSIRPFISQNLENITLQKLFAKTCLELGYLEEALNTFKQLLLINPKDKYVADQVKLLEDDLILSEQEQVQVGTVNAESSFDDSEWVQVDFSTGDTEEPNTKVEKEAEAGAELDDWSIASKSPLENFKDEIKNQKIEVAEHRLDDEFFHEEYDNQSDEVILPEAELEHDEFEDKPIITHTLVDLYCGQGHFQKAIDVLQSILELHPDDGPTLKRMLEVQAVLNEPEKSIETTENHQLEELKNTFESFLSKIVAVSKQKLSEV